MGKRITQTVKVRVRPEDKKRLQRLFSEINEHFQEVEKKMSDTPKDFPEDADKSNVVDIGEYRKERRQIRYPERKTTFEGRIERIKNSLEKINRLMRELKSINHLRRIK